MKLKYCFLESLGIQEMNPGACYGDWIKKSSGSELVSINPSTKEVIASVIRAELEDYETVMNQAQKSFLSWRMKPAPERGEIVFEILKEVIQNKDDLGALVTLETGKIFEEGKGEVQEIIDHGKKVMGLGRELNGLILPSERPGHTLQERWHPLGPIGIITSFNFPMAVWAWNALLAAVCGDTMIWKPSQQTPLCAIALQNICNRVMEKHGLKGVFNLVIGQNETIGEQMITDNRLPLISFTGSCRIGRHVGEVVRGRFGKDLLELGGNNAAIVLKDANLQLALRAILFGAVGTAGQRCTTTRRVIMEKPISKELTKLLKNAYQQVKVGDPFDSKMLMGPLIDQTAVNKMMAALKDIKKQGGEIIYGGKILGGSGFFVEPTLVKIKKDAPILKKETFAPILYLLEVNSPEEAIAVNNDVPQGLSSAIFTRSLEAMEEFLGARGSDCGLANVNTSTSGAEIGTAFGGEKETGGGREAGSDSWKNYMRRQSCAINHTDHLPKSQGIKFGDD